MGDIQKFDILPGGPSRGADKTRLAPENRPRSADRRFAPRSGSTIPGPYSERIPSRKRGPPLSGDRVLWRKKKSHKLNDLCNCLRGTSAGSTPIFGRSCRIGLTRKTYCRRQVYRYGGNGTNLTPSEIFFAGRAASLSSRYFGIGESLHVSGCGLARN